MPEYRTRRGEKITQDSYLIVRKFSQVTAIKGKPFKGTSMWSMLEKSISVCCLNFRQDHTNRHKRKDVSIFHDFRKFFTTQLVNSKINPEIREMLLGHNSFYNKDTRRIIRSTKKT